MQNNASHGVNFHKNQLNSIYFRLNAWKIICWVIFHRTNQNPIKSAHFFRCCCCYWPPAAMTTQFIGHNCRIAKSANYTPKTVIYFGCGGESTKKFDRSKPFKNSILICTCLKTQKMKREKTCTHKRLNSWCSRYSRVKQPFNALKMCWACAKSLISIFWNFS